MRSRAIVQVMIPLVARLVDLLDRRLVALAA
jgi:hypothetical protein